MSVTLSPCACGGRPLERLEERGIGQDDHNWYPVGRNSISHELADAWIAADPACPLRWAPAPCPNCDGSGFYPVERAHAHANPPTPYTCGIKPTRF